MTDRPQLGFGVSGPLGEPWFDRRKAAAIAKAAFDGGVRWFDTAPFYGVAEARLGDALSGVEGAIFASKTGTRREARRVIKDFSESSMRQDLETTLTRLRRDKLDVLFLHGPTTEQMKDALPILRGFQERNLVAKIGVCAEGQTAMHAVELGFEALMASYNVFDRRHAPAFQKARANGMLTFGIAPLGQALYARNFWRLAGLSDVWRITRGLTVRRLDRARAIASRGALESIEGWAPVEAALAFALEAPFLDVVLTTTTKPERLERAIRTSGRRLDPAALARLQALSLDPPQVGA